MYRAHLRDRIRQGKVIAVAVGFIGTVLGYIIYPALEIKVCLVFNGVQEGNVLIKPGKCFPITASLKSAYVYQDNYFFTLKENSICVTKGGFIEHLKKEYKLLKELNKINTKQSKKAIAARCFYHMAKALKRRKLWLISDRINKADDNGEALFKYLNEKKVPENLFFVLRKDSADYETVRKYGKIIAYNSIKHKLFHLLADAIISSAGNEYVKNPFGDGSVYYQDILNRQKRVLLRHGVGQNNQTKWLNKFNHNFSMIVTSAIPEYESFLSWEYYYDANVIKLTGLSRHDRLFDKKKRIITIMPTWRNNLVDNAKIAYYKIDGRYRYQKKKFKETDYYCFYNSLINDKRLLQKAEEYGYTIQFMPHPNIITYINWFEKNGNAEFSG